MDSNTIGLIISGVLGFIILVSALWGIKRGFKKTFFRFCWLLGSAVVLFLLTPTISNLLNNIDISSLGIDINGPVTKLSDIGANIVNGLVADGTIVESSALISFAENITTVVLNILVFVLFFWLLKWLLWPIWAIVSSKLFDKQKREIKRYKREQKINAKNNQENNNKKNADKNMPILLSVKENKHRFWGLIMGVVTGLLIATVTFSPIVGLNSIYQNVKANVLVEDEYGQKVSLVSNELDEETLQLINCYEDSIANKIMNYSGAGLISNYSFKNLAVVKVNNQKINLEEEIALGINVYNQAMVIAKFNADNITTEGVDEVLKAINSILNNVSNSKMIYLFGDDLLPKYLDEYVDGEEFVITGDEQIDDILKNCYLNYEVFRLKDIQDQIISLLNIVSVCNSNGLIEAFANTSDITAESATKIISDNILNSSDFAKKITNNLFNITLIKEQIPDFLNLGIKAIYDYLGEEFKEQTITVETVKNNLTTLLANAIDFCKYYSNSENFDFKDDTSNVLKTAGKTLDIFRKKNGTNNLLSEDNYQTLINYLKREINNAIGETIDISSISDNLSNVESWETELSKYAKAYKIGIKLFNEGFSFDLLKEESNSYMAEIGEALDDIVKTSKIINNESIRNILENLLNGENLDLSSVNDILNIENNQHKKVKDIILDNIWSSDNKQDIVWQTEFTNIKSLLNTDFSSSTSLQTIGNALDKVKDSKLLVNVINTIVTDYIDKNLDNEIKSLTVYNTMISNLDNVESYEDEFSKFQDLIDKLGETFDNDNDKLIAFGTLFDDICNINDEENKKASRVLTKGVLCEFLKYYFDKFVTSSALDDELKTIILSAKNNINTNIVSFKQEMESISDLSNIINNSSSSLEKIGETLDSVSENSKIINENVIKELILYYIDEKIDMAVINSNNLGDVLDKIKDNVQSKTIKNSETDSCYKTEFAHLNTLTNLITSTIDLSSVGSTLDEICNTSDDSSKVASILLDRETVINDLVKVLFEKKLDENSSSLGNKNTEGTLAKKLLNLKDNVEEIESFSTEFGHLTNLIDTINDTYVDNGNKTAEELKLEAIGTCFDSIADNANAGANESKFIKRDNINSIIGYYFKEKTTSYQSGDYKSIIDKIEVKVGNSTNFNTMFAELNQIIKNLSDISSYSSPSDITSIDGTIFDDMAGMEQACDKKITHDIVKVFFTKIFGFNTTTNEFNVYNSIINSSDFDFNNYTTENYDYNVSHADLNYYKELIEQINPV